MEEEGETHCCLALNGHDALDACIWSEQFAMEVLRGTHHEVFKPFVNREVANERMYGDDIAGSCGANGQGGELIHSLIIAVDGSAGETSDPDSASER